MFANYCTPAHTFFALRSSLGYTRYVAAAERHESVENAESLATIVASIVNRKKHQIHGRDGIVGFGLHSAGKYFREGGWGGGHTHARTQRDAHKEARHTERKRVDRQKALVCVCLSWCFFPLVYF